MEEPSKPAWKKPCSHSCFEISPEPSASIEANSCSNFSASIGELEKNLRSSAIERLPDLSVSTTSKMTSGVVHAL